MSAPAKTSPPRPASKSPRTATKPDWQAPMLEHLRQLILSADPAITEEPKWKKPSKPEGVPVWSRGGIVCTGETYKQVVKLTFMRGASLPDPAGLFNASLEGNVRRAIDIRENEVLNADAFKALVRAAVAENLRVAAKR